MTDLYSYVVKSDTGLAPNPFWGICTLVVCKPKIRVSAQVGDWIVGTGSAASPVGDTSGDVIYAMRVSKKLTMAEYDAWVNENCPQKLPDPASHDLRRRGGDSLYDFSRGRPVQRASAHAEADSLHDLGGKFALLSDHYFYFGKSARPLPRELLPIVKRGPGHRVRDNQPYLEAFVAWIERQPRGISGDPQRELPRAEKAPGCAPGKSIPVAVRRPTKGC